MTEDTRGVLAAIERWREKELIDEWLAGHLRAEVAAASETGTRRLTQVLVAGTAAVALLIAGGLFLDWAWPLMGEAARTGVLALIGLAVVVGGAGLEGRRGWMPAAYLMQTAGLGLLLTAFIYSEQAWDDVSAGGIVTGGLSFAVPILLAPRAMRRNAVMPAVHLAAALAFFAVFLDRATPLSADAIVWVLDAVLAVSMLRLVSLLRGDLSGERHPWALNAFATAMLAGFVLVTLTATGPLDMTDAAAWPLDAWLVLVAGLTHWGIHHAPTDLRRDWFGRMLANCMLLWIPLGMWTVHGALDGSSELALLVVGGVGVAGFLYGDRNGMRELLATATIAFVIPLWMWAVERGGALGAVAALALTAALLFWISGRIRTEDRAPAEGESAGAGVGGAAAVE